MEERGGKGKMKTRALDCGAGVGRVSENVLSKIVDEVHLVEPVRKVSSKLSQRERGVIGYS